MDSDRLIQVICMIPALVAGLTVHEFAHAWAADKLGDDTPRRQGRLQLDPMVHIDPLGAFFFLIAAFSGYGIGWAKPVMTNHRNLQHPRRDSLLIAIAGPISNLLQTPFWLITLFIFGFVAQKMGLNTGPSIPGGGPVYFEISEGHSIPWFLETALIYGVSLNIGLAAFNMIPFPPLDGHWVLQAIGGRPVEELFDMIRPFAFIFLILIINMTPILRIVLGPIYEFAYTTAYSVELAGARLAH